ncbi:MAG: holo-acyl-carrier protein synthase, partial [Halothiobacillaceae bacterium]
DIVQIARIERALERHGERFAQKILCAPEFADFQQRRHPAAFLAKRFAAKEATAKAMGIGFRHGMSLQHIEVVHDAVGKPSLLFHDRALVLKEALGCGAAYLSMADETDTAIAFVTILLDANRVPSLLPR